LIAFFLATKQRRQQKAEKQRVKGVALRRIAALEARLDIVESEVNFVEEEATLFSTLLVAISSSPGQTLPKRGYS